MTIKDIFQHHFQAACNLVAHASGRVNLIGEHTDYNDGFVLPCAIDFATQVALQKTTGNEIEIYAADYDETDRFCIDQPIQTSDKQWANYVRGVVWALADKGFKLPHGARLAIAGNVPQGAGLSSSAALEVAVAKAFQAAFAWDLNETDLALIGQYAENHFVGCQCGIMDQLTSARGQEHHAILIDCRHLSTEAIPISSQLSIMIIHSHVQRGLVGSEYNTRRQQCEAAAKHFGVVALRDVDWATFTANQTGLDPLVAQRAKYIIQENQRTLDAAQALKNNDIKTLSRLMFESHEGMKNEFDITHPAVDILVDLVRDVIGNQGGVRMTGGGFGGCVVALVPQSLVEPVKQHLAQHYQAKTGLKEEVFVCQPSAGVRLLD